MVTGLSKMHIHWMLEDLKKKEGRAAKEQNFMDYPYRAIAKALKNYFGRDDNYCVLYLFQDKETLMVLHQKQWIRISFEQLKIFL